ncbi:hypothetical protein BIY27_25915 [Gibbsiella quercinecans]|nr:hypothetical protein BIY27_25915 [Gibbsiella quercinecans]
MIIFLVASEDAVKFSFSLAIFDFRDSAYSIQVQESKSLLKGTSVNISNNSSVNEFFLKHTGCMLIWLEIQVI